MGAHGLCKPEVGVRSPVGPPSFSSRVTGLDRLSLLTREVRLLRLSKLRMLTANKNFYGKKAKTASCFILTMFKRRTT